MLALVTLEDLRTKRLHIGLSFRHSAMEVFFLPDMEWRKLVAGSCQRTFRATCQKVLRLCYF
jgi:hypothetical protein